MPRLTRTQKFADLRESLANDKESSLATKELDGYKDRLNTLTEQLTPVQTESNSTETVVEPVSKEVKEVEEELLQVETDPKYSWQEYEETPIDDLLNTFKNEELDKHIEEIKNEADLWDRILQEVEQKAKQENNNSNNQIINDIDKIEEYVISGEDVEAIEKENEQVAQQEEVQQEVKEEVVNEPVEVVNEPVEVVSEPVEVVDDYNVEEILDTDEVQTNNEPQNNIDYLNYNPVIENAYAEAEKANEEVQQEPIYEEVSIDETNEEEIDEILDTDEYVDNHEIDHSADVQSNYVNETIDEVDEYNHMNGEQTINTITNNMVNEIRHSDDQETVEENAQEETAEENDDEFSNTVSMEITKIMNEVSDVQPQPEEHPVATQALEAQEDGVEIKNIDELEAENTREATSSTIPFIVSNSDDEELEDEDEEDGSNTILNVILIVLIIILIAVLGLIVFYILRTRGII